MATRYEKKAHARQSHRTKGARPPEKEVSA
jgi:hypothetical protein